MRHELLSVRILEVIDMNIEVTSDDKVMRKSSNVRVKRLKVFKKVGKRRLDL
jgi:hypothetical protein